MCVSFLSHFIQEKYSIILEILRALQFRNHILLVEFRTEMIKHRRNVIGESIWKKMFWWQMHQLTQDKKLLMYFLFKSDIKCGAFSFPAHTVQAVHLLQDLRVITTGSFNWSAVTSPKPAGEHSFMQNFFSIYCCPT